MSYQCATTLPCGKCPRCIKAKMTEKQEETCANCGEIKKTYWSSEGRICMDCANEIHEKATGKKFTPKLKQPTPGCLPKNHSPQVVARSEMIQSPMVEHLVDRPGAPGSSPGQKDTPSEFKGAENMLDKEGTQNLRLPAGVGKGCGKIFYPCDSGKPLHIGISCGDENFEEKYRYCPECQEKEK